MRTLNFFVTLPLLAASLSLTGCTLVNSATPSVQDVKLSGSVFGGGLPISGAHLYLFAANTAGSAGSGIAPATSNASLSLLQAAANTSADANGNYYATTSASGGFTLTGDYATCTPGQQLYLYATGGDAGDGYNSAAGLMAVIGGCTATYPNPSVKVHINEMTTVAAAYALAGFASDATHISDDEAVPSTTTAARSGTRVVRNQANTSNPTASIAAAGMANAFANAANLVTLGTGAALTTTPGGNGTVPASTLNTIADILADCVQSAGPASTPCANLFAFTGTSSTADAATAAIRLAQNPAGAPGTSVTATTLFNDIPPNAAFTPALVSVPNDFTVAISFTGTNIQYPDAIAVDNTGNVWMANFNANTVSQFSATGATYTETEVTDPSLNQPIAIAVDNTGGVWLANSNGNSITQFSGSSYNPASYTGGNLSYPYSIAVDGNDNVWVANLTAGLSEFTGSGTSYTGTSLAAGNVSLPVAVTVDDSGDVWTANYGDSSITDFSLSSGVYTPVNFTGGNTASPVAIAADANNNVWVANSGNSSVSRFLGFGTVFIGVDVNGGGVNTPSAIAVDGAGAVWVANSVGGSISGFSNDGVALSPNGFTGTAGPAGGTAGPLLGPNGIAIDPSGNVWVADSSNTAVEFIGAAAPTVTPLSQAVLYGKLGTRP